MPVRKHECACDGGERFRILCLREPVHVNGLAESNGEAKLLLDERVKAAQGRASASQDDARMELPAEI